MAKKKTTHLRVRICFALMLLVVFFVMSGCHSYSCDNLSDELRNLEESTQYLYILWRPADQSVNDFKGALLNHTGPQLISYTPLFRKITIRVIDPAIKSITLRERPRNSDGAILSALISVVLDKNDTGGGLNIAAIIDPTGNYVAGYKTAVTIPREYDKNWDDGDVSPGIVLISFFRRLPGISDEEFKSHWFCSHTPLSLEVHPLFRYERNVIKGMITQNAPDYEGIVPENLREVKDLTNIKRFLGGKLVRNGIRINIDFKRFIDNSTIEVAAMREYVLRSGQKK